MTTRRRFLGLAGATGAAALGLPRLSFAAAPTERRLVLVILRGGMDGLALVAPHADPDYAKTRQSLAMPPPGDGEDALRDLDGFYGLHPAAGDLYEIWQRNELSIVHAVATPYRGRSHFEAQDVLENGGTTPNRPRDGWLNRTVTAMGGAEGFAIAVSRQVPLVLQGKAPAASWAPSALPKQVLGYFTKMALLYDQDPELGPIFKTGLETRRRIEFYVPEADRNAGRGAARAEDTLTAARLAGAFLAEDDGARIAVLEMSGWDTHARQGTSHGRLARRFSALSAALAEMADALGPAWDETAVVVATEFGRTAAPNGTGGTDHGTGGAALVLGGAVIGGTVHGEWPGLAKASLFEGRDLKPTIDMRAVFKGVLRDHMGMATGALDSVFPGSSGMRPLDGLIV